MKTILQLDIKSNFNKNYYRIKKNCLQITKDTPPIQFSFDNICYSPQDVNFSLIYDIIVDFSEKNNVFGSTRSTQSININNQPTINEQSDRDYEKDSLNINISSGALAQQNFKQPQYKYSIIFDQITQNNSIQNLIKQISTTEIFKKQKIKIGHFLAHHNGVYDFHQSKVIQSDSQRQELEKEYLKKHGSIQDNFMWIYNKEINLCEQVKINNISQLLKNISYISAQQFCKLHQPALGIQLASNITRAQQIKHKELQNKKILQFFVINIGTKVRIVIALLNYNKNYSFTAQEQKQLYQLFTLSGVMVGEVKYHTIKIQILNKIMKNIEKLYYVMYFPGSKLPTIPITQNLNIPGIRKNQKKKISSNFFSSMNTNDMINSQPKSNFSVIDNHVKRMRASVICGNLFSQQKQMMQHMYNSTSATRIKFEKSNYQMQQTKFLQYSRTKNSSPEKKDKVMQQINSMFYNYNTLKTKDRDTLQKIIKEYLVKKQDNLKAQLQKIKQRLKQLKLNQRIEQAEVTQLKIKCTKSLQKMSQSILQLQRMGIHNVQRHMDWLKLVVDEKKQIIKQDEQQIEELNKRIIQNKKSHEYFYSKMQQYKQKLIKKQQRLQKTRSMHTRTSSIQLNKTKDKQNQNSQMRNQLSLLSLAQLQVLQQHKQKLKAKLVEKLKNSSQKKSFFDTLAELKNKVSKLQLTRLEQKYFDLLHD